MRPIDADALTQDILSLTVLYDNEYYKGRADERNDILQRIQSEPTVEKCGKIVWFEERVCGNPLDGYEYNWGWQCSECEYVFDDEYDDPDCSPDVKYCPDCGAKILK